MQDEITGNGNINVLNGAYLGLSSNITNIENALNLDNASFDVANNSIGSTTLSNLTLSGDNLMKVDVDVASLKSDTLKFNDPADLVINPNTSLEISDVNLMNSNKAYTDEKYYIPFISEADNNQNILGAVSFMGKKIS